MKIIGSLLIATVIATCTSDKVCPDTFVNLGGVCYYFSTTQSTWFEAYNECNAMGSSLLSIDNKGEEFLINLHLTFQYKNSTYWTSGSDVESEGHFKWTATGQQFQYTNWCKGQPDNSGGFEDCVHIHHTNKISCWNDFGCKSNTIWGLPLYFICEYHIPQYKK